MTQSCMSIADQWQMFRKANVPIECGVEELRQRRLMFYAGFLCGFTSLADALDSTDLDYVKSIEAELSQFTATI